MFTIVAAQEKAIGGVEKFDRSSLKRADTQEKQQLPDSTGQFKFPPRNPATFMLIHCITVLFGFVDSNRTGEAGRDVPEVDRGLPQRAAASQSHAREERASGCDAD